MTSAEIPALEQDKYLVKVTVGPEEPPPDADRFGVDPTGIDLPSVQESSHLKRYLAGMGDGYMTSPFWVRVSPSREVARPEPYGEVTQFEASVTEEELGRLKDALKRQ
jgi:hypothetical protein